MVYKKLFKKLCLWLIYIQRSARMISKKRHGQPDERRDRETERHTYKLNFTPPGYFEPQRGDKFSMIKSQEPAAGFVLLTEKVPISEQFGIISLSSEYVCIHGKDIINIHLIGYYDHK